jgi:DNA-binding GntR family transcriptional regulator
MRRVAMLEIAGKERSHTEFSYWALRADLLACRLKPGEKLNIASMASNLGVSLGAVREALSRLTAEGLVTLETNRGYWVAPVSETELRDLTSTRIELESACLRRSIQFGGVEWETAIVAAHHRMSRIAERVSDDASRISDDWAEAHREFHAALVSACDSPWRIRLRDFLYDQTERYRRLSAPATPQERDLASEHRRLMEATVARDASLATELLAEHLTVTADRVRALAEAEHRSP